MQINLKIDDKAVREKLNGLQKAMLTTKKPLTQAGDELLEYFSESVFNRGGGEKKWKGLSPSTARARIKGWGHYKNNPEQRGRTLVWTGRLRKGFVKTVSRAKLVIKNTVPYFKQHQLGEGKLPKRQMLSADKHVERTVLKVFTKYFKKFL